MKHRKAAARAVIMHHQIMHPQHARIAAHGVLNVLHKGRVGRFPQQCAERIPHHADAAVQDEHSHAKAHHAVHPGNAGELGDKQRYQHRRCRDHIVAAVRCCGHKHLGIDHAANAAVEGSHPKLYQDRCRQHRHAQPAERCDLRLPDLAKALFAQLQTDDQDHHRNSQSGNVFIAGMAVGMLGIRRGAAQLKAHQTDHIAAGVRQVV